MKIDILDQWAIEDYKYKKGIEKGRQEREKEILEIIEEYEKTNVFLTDLKNQIKEDKE